MAGYHACITIDEDDYSSSEESSQVPAFGFSLEGFNTIEGS
jgi:hypothetical protein